MSQNFPSANSPPFFDIKFSAALYTFTHELKMALIKIFGSLEEITVDNEHGQQDLKVFPSNKISNLLLHHSGTILLMEVLQQVLDVAFCISDMFYKYCFYL